MWKLNRIVIVLVFVSMGLAQAQDQNIKALTGATIYDGNGNQITNGTIIIGNGKIGEIGENVQIPAGAEKIDVSGKYIMPGMVDAHVHFFQTGFFDSRPDAADLRDSIPLESVVDYQRTNPDRYYPAYIGSGITAVYDVGDYLWTLNLQKNNDQIPDAPHVATAGPLITPAPKERIQIFDVEGDQTFVHLDSEETGRKAVRKNSNAGTTGIKIWGFQPDDPQFMKNIEAVADEIEKQDNKMIAHATSLREAKLALELGAKLLVHSVEDTIVDQEFLELLNRNQALYNPTMIVSRGYYNTYNALLGEEFEIDDPKGLVDSKTRNVLQNAADFQKYRDSASLARLKNALPSMDKRMSGTSEIMKTNLKKVYDSGAKIVVGTDAGNPGTLHGISYIKELEAMQDAGIPARDLIIMATRNGAIAMERLSDFGTLEAGKVADLLILSEDPAEDISHVKSLEMVMRKGEFYQD
ncbi:amidohydrolase family protein [Gramella sp. GC03-9]|uniref:Amidohydrolase family protein n=1 Tax=Christiangramia oceanisediminis TaxID=2920386 RepID=A0A9X2I881_9FLAO|nr:amidohydrolase family protein [Gramella oceanisediminis]MCP9199614.1 amidohydrolase family protein [Gramella oceanisediminis]